VIRRAVPIGVLEARKRYNFLIGCWRIETASRFHGAHKAFPATPQEYAALLGAAGASGASWFAAIGFKEQTQ
jgi:hypothetical protein